MKRYHRFSSFLKKKEFEINTVDSIQLLGEELSKKNIFDPVDEIQIVGKKIQENIKEPIDEIQIIGKEKIQGIIEPIDEIEIFGKERIPNVYEPIDEIEIIGNDQDNENIDKNKENNIICMPAFEFQICSEKKNGEKNSKIENKKDKALKALIDDNDSSIDDKDKSDKENIDDNIDLNMNETEDNKLKEINKLKLQLENEKIKLKQLVKKIIELESEMNEDKN